MDSIREIVGRAFPGREFTDDEVAFAEAVVKASMRTEGSHIGLPTRYVEVGGIVGLGAYRYRCVARGRVESPSGACLGCDFSRKSRGCWDLQCAAVDRRDRRNVWFEEVTDGE